MFDSASARRMMVDGQVRTADIHNPDLLTAMLTIPRELFVPPSLAEQAYIDSDIDIAPGRVLLKPMVFAKLIEAADVRGWLGRPHFFFEAADRTSVPGVVTGLAVTGTGGDVLFVEASVSDGPEGLTLTGQLGDVMKESAEIALSYVRSHAAELGIDPGAFTAKRFHVHVPAGAVPKDGPSAGVTMTTALVSLLRGVPVRPVVGMTGEVTLQGRVLPIGGVKQKVLAAHRAGLTEVVLPARNGPDLEDVPEEVRDAMTFHLAATIGDVLAPALSEAGAAPVPQAAAA